MILHLDQEGNDCIRKLWCHCIQILHSDIYSVQSNLAIRNCSIRNKLVLRNHFLWPICHSLYKDKEHLALRNNFRQTKKFLIIKFNSHEQLYYLNWLWEIETFKLELVWRWFWDSKSGICGIKTIFHSNSIQTIHFNMRHPVSPFFRVSDYPDYHRLDNERRS